MRPRTVAALVTALFVAAACSASPEAPAAPRSTAPEPVEAPEPVAYAFVDAGRAAGITLDPRRSWGSVWVDYDDDGDPDLLANRHFFPPFMLEHEGELYSEAAWQDTLRSEDFDRHACLWGDPNADGRADLLCTQGAERGKGSGPNQLLIQDADGAFADKAAEFGIDYPRGRSRTANWIDYDNDDDFDLFVGTQLRQGYPSQMFRNDDGVFRRARVGLAQELEVEASAWEDWDGDGDADLILTLKNANAVAYENRRGRFERVRVAHVTDRDWLGVAFGEFNGDRWPDLHLINERRSLVLVNRRGSFDVVHRMSTSEGRMGAWFDADNDADQDLFVVQGAPGDGDDPDAVDASDILLVRKGSSFTKRTIDQSGARQGNGDSATVADHDRDGTLDLFVTNGYKRSAGPFVLLENRTVGGNWAGLELTGAPGNPLALWIEVRVTVGPKVLWRQVTDGLTFRSQSEVGYVHFGLGGETTAEIMVSWPSGVRDCLDLAAGTIGSLQEGTAPCA